MKVSKADAAFITKLDKHPYEEQLAMIPTLKPAKLKFLAKCLGCIVNQDPKFKLSSSEKATIKKSYSPHQTDLIKLVRGAGNRSIQGHIRKQTGRGILLSTLIGAAIPLITKLIQKIAGKK